ncbi:MAG: DNA-binding protein [Campylobacterota bacterium]|nr:DNA-binding protein [Campylobacterota bacterium]
MHTITLKSDDNFFEMLNEMVKSLGTTKSELIRTSVVHYKSVLEKEKLKKQIKLASLKTREVTESLVDEFETTIWDGLEDV